MKRAALAVGLAAAVAVGGVALWRHGSDPRRRPVTTTATTGETKIVRRRLARLSRPIDLYAHDRVGMISRVARGDPARVYVPNSEANSVDVINPHTYKVIERFSVGTLPQHVTPAHDLETLYVNNDVGNSLTPIDPRTGRAGDPIDVDDPYNLYFTPNGRYAIVVAERLHRLDFRSPHTFRLIRALSVPCAGVNHMDFSANGRFAIVSCEFSGQLLKVDVTSIRYCESGSCRAVSRCPRMFARHRTEGCSTLPTSRRGVCGRSTRCGSA